MRKVDAEEFAEVLTAVFMASYEHRDDPERIYDMIEKLLTTNRFYFWQIEQIFKADKGFRKGRK